MNTTSNFKKTLFVLLLLWTSSYTAGTECTDCADAETRTADGMTSTSQTYDKTKTCGKVYEAQNGAFAKQETVEKRAKEIADNTKIRKSFEANMKDYGEGEVDKDIKIAEDMEKTHDNTKAEEAREKNNQKGTKAERQAARKKERELLGAIAKQLRAVKKDIRTHAKSAYTNMGKCIGFVKRAQLGNLCLRTSGNGEKFFNKANKKFYISTKTCDQFYTRCSKIFALSSLKVAVRQTLKRLKNEIKSKDYGVIEKFEDKGPEYIDELAKVIAEDPTKATDANKAKFCGEHFTLIKYKNEVVGIESSDDGTIDASDLNVSRRLLIGNGASLRRLLAEVSQGQTGEVEVTSDASKVPDYVKLGEETGLQVTDAANEATTVPGFLSILNLASLVGLLLFWMVK